MEKIWFTGWGFLVWLDPEEYFSDGWRYVGTDEGDDGERYDIVEKDNEYRYTNI